MKKRKNNLSDDDLKKLYQLYKLPMYFTFGEDFAEEIYSMCMDSIKMISGDKNAGIAGYMMAITDLIDPEFKNFERLVEVRNKKKEKMESQNE